MEYYCHRPGSREEIATTTNYLNKAGCSVEPVAIDGVVYFKVVCPEGTEEEFIGNNTLPDYAVKLPSGEKFCVRKLFHRPTLLDEYVQCVLFIAPERDHADT
ncbi:MAG TPA: hypothetical protein VFB60_27040 [Ktedonobacteraceae bacterium]|nr:hypothetical protein [Ktedonobacteraceae bacterium]